MIFLVMIAWMINVAVWAWLGIAVWKRHVHKRQRDMAEKMRARDVFTLHPGTKGLMTENPDTPLMWELPSGRIVYQRYWHRLEGVEAAE